jgi:hypothetical protein
MCTAHGCVEGRPNSSWLNQFPSVRWLGQGERRSHGVEQGRDGEVPSSGHDQTGGDARGDAARDAKAAVPDLLRRSTYRPRTATSPSSSPSLPVFWSWLPSDSPCSTAARRGALFRMYNPKRLLCKPRWVAGGRSCGVD